MPSWQGKSKGNKLGYRIFIGVLRYGGIRPAYFLLVFVSVYYCLFSWNTARSMYRFFRYKIQYPRWRAIASVYRNIYIFGQTLIDKVVVMAGIPNRFSFDFDGEERLHAMVSSGKGGIMLSAHLGNWEVAGHLFTRLNTRINIVMFDGEHERIKSYLEGVTGGRNVNVIVLKDDLSHIYAINDALGKQELVCMHADRFLAGNKTAEKMFLGEPARFPVGPFLLASTFRVPVSFVFAFKETATHYHLYATDPKVYPGAKQGGLDQSMDDFVSVMEEKVRKYPLQWFNYYDFWSKD